MTTIAAPRPGYHPTILNCPTARIGLATASTIGVLGMLASNTVVGSYRFAIAIALIVGIAFGNTLRHRLGSPGGIAGGLHFATRQVLRMAITLYGFNVTVDSLVAIGWGGAALDGFIVVSTLFIGYFAGTRILRLDPETAVLCASGAAICGAAAIMATESAVSGSPAKTTVAMGTVVLFGTLATFLYPLLHAWGFPGLANDAQFGAYLGATIHEVAQVVAAGSQISDAATQVAVPAKMGRVLLLVPVLMALGWIWRRIHAWQDPDGQVHLSNVPVPWFAVAFLGVVVVNSLITLPKEILHWINTGDMGLLCVAMAALGMDTTWSKIKHVGPKPLVLGAILAVWLIVGGAVASRVFLG